ncbi:PrpF domain-containing protein [Kitasatospora brasiliensis]|uniref:PrpF domain-containing protein n=1 Tax=Kitasatospora brasiliensis TaxID=3058040 RepID=UPI00292E2C38|nr:PrpF domain-containing protein [Kitasatospora sp. K002]
MIGHLASAVGAPCPTLVLDAALLPADECRLRPALAAIRGQLGGQVLKFALISPSAAAGGDLDYRFVQGLPGRAERFDFGAACGHSGLAAALVAERLGWVRELRRPGAAVRLHGRGGALVVEAADPGEYTLHYEPEAAAEPLPTGRASEALRTASGEVRASLVAFGNPYAFVAAADLGLRSGAELFAADARTAARLAPIRAAAAARLGHPADGALPKLALIGAVEPAGLPVRALTVTGWHPGLALTGAGCLAAALTLPGTLPHRLADGAAPLLFTPAGPVTAIAVRQAGRLTRVTVPHKRARLLGRVALAWRGPVASAA